MKVAPYTDPATISIRINETRNDSTTRAVVNPAPNAGGEGLEFWCDPAKRES